MRPQQATDRSALDAAGGRQPLGLAYCLSVGALVGLITAVLSLDFGFFFGDDRLVNGIRFDAGSSFAGLRYFINDSWHWPLLETHSLSSDGEPAIIALTDSLPLLALPAKILRPLGISAGTWIGFWYYGSLVAQGTAAGLAAFTHRARGRITPLTLAVFSCTAPVLFLRIWHPGLFAQFSLILVWAARGWIRQRGTTSAAVAMLVPLLLALVTHPYIFLMSLAMAAAIMLDAWFSRSINLRQFGTWAVTSVVVLLAAMFGLGYLPSDADPPGGYGAFAMHVVGPIWPQWSRLWPGDEWLLLVDNNSFEGVNYLGGGAVIALALTITSPRRVWQFLNGNQATIIAACVLAAIAITPEVYFTDNRPHNINEYFVDRPNAKLAVAIFAISALTTFVVFHVRGFFGANFKPGFVTLVTGGITFLAVDRLKPNLFDNFLNQFRASGRLFWIVGYGLMLGAVILLDQAGSDPTDNRPNPSGRPPVRYLAASGLMLLLAAAQAFDTTMYRERVPFMFATTEEDVARIDRLAAVVEGHESIHLEPDWFCTNSVDALSAFQEVVIAGSLANVPVDSYYGGRTDESASCPTTVDGPVDDGRLIAIAAPLAESWSRPTIDGRECRGDQLLILCSDRWSEMPPNVSAGFPPVSE